MPVKTENLLTSNLVVNTCRRQESAMIRLLVLGALIATWGSVECRPKEKVNNRILGGENTGPHEFPGTLAMIYMDSEELLYICTASIINSYWGLTAGHCCAVSSEAFVFAGSSNRSQGTMHSIISEKCIVHEEFIEKPHLLNDIAVFKVEPEFNLDGVTMKPIKLPEVGDLLPEEFEATAVGWGIYQLPEDYAYILQKIQLTIHEENVSGENKLISTSEGISGLCDGDPGGPLYYNGIVVGLASFVDPQYCNTTGYMSFHTKVSSFRNWIDTTILKHK